MAWTDEGKNGVVVVGIGSGYEEVAGWQSETLRRREQRVGTASKGVPSSAGRSERWATVTSAACSHLGRLK